MKTLAVLLFALSAQPAFAARHDVTGTLPSGPKAFTGAWRIGHDGEGSQTCVLRLNAAGVIGGYQVEVPRNCQGIVDRAQEIFAWFPGPGDTLVFVDAARQAVYHFRKLPGGSWASEGSDEDRYLLQKVVIKHRR